MAQHSDAAAAAAGSGLVWQSLRWPDGTAFDGLTKGGAPHSHGVLTFPNRDRYEGQFERGVMHGAGVYVWANGTVYRGDWTHGQAHGCGTRTQSAGGEVSACEGKFFAGAFVGDVMPCSKQDGYEAAVEADMAALQARSFKKDVWQQQQEQQQQLQQQQQLRRRPAGRPQQQQPGDTDPRLTSLVQRLVADKVAQAQQDRQRQDRRAAG